MNPPVIGRSAALESALRTARLVAATDATVLLTGETGTGKEVAARLIHESSRRAGGPFIAVNCSALPEALVEAELFGHRRGAFSGATQDSLGKIRAASGGTLLLDEVGDLPLAAQAKLLRFLESGEVQPLGESRAARGDTRVVAATNRDLMGAVGAGRFREDLFYRLHVVPIELPPLRERDGDVALLAAHFLARFAEQHDRPAPRLGKCALKRLHAHAWPGNVRELRNLCERLVILHPGATIEAAMLPLPAPAPASRAGLALPAEGLDIFALERSLMAQALALAGGNQSHAARLLGMSRDRFLYRLRKGT
ncbi:MAG: sigma-54-dependent Fis family transcriptional regulator [Alphaproteobacteria bacterium]|nr:sigma-54-dependent Fis family transcriptional regulator [Alphaproteobacteria bacterium]